ncbi:hypothetical protein ACQJBY_027242 [Aegilops geniculata]
MTIILTCTILGRDARRQVRVDIVLMEPGLCVVFSILQRMMNYTLEFSRGRISGDPCFQIAGIEGQKRYICRGAASVAPLLPKGKVKEGACVVLLQFAARIAMSNLHKNA